MTQMMEPRETIIVDVGPGVGTAIQERVYETRPSDTAGPVSTDSWVTEYAQSSVPHGVSMRPYASGIAESTWSVVYGWHPSLWTEIQRLQARVADLEDQVEDLKPSAHLEEGVVVLRTVDRDQAEEEIRELFEGGETLYYSDIARRLRIDLPLVVEICQGLMEAREIEVADAV